MMIVGKAKIRLVVVGSTKIRLVLVRHLRCTLQIRDDCFDMTESLQCPRII